MPREQHIMRQVEWKEKLSQFGCKVQLEKTTYIQGAPIIVDVYAEAEGKTFLIEIGDIDDKRKTALMKLYAKQNDNIEFIHEPYNVDKIGLVLEKLTEYEKTEEYRQIQIEKEKKEIKKKREERQKWILALTILSFFVIGLFYFSNNKFILLIWIILWIVMGGIFVRLYSAFSDV